MQRYVHTGVNHGMLRSMTIITTRYLDTRLTREFWAKTRLDPETLCWVWTARTSQTGTPMHGAKVAWRFAHERLVGPLVRGSVGRRACDEPLCVNPAHRVTEKPRNCPTCGSPMAQDTRSEIYEMADGKIAVNVVAATDEAPEPIVHRDFKEAQHSVQEILETKPVGPAPQPEDDPDHVPYRKGEAKLSGKVWVKDASNKNDWFELEDGTWIPRRAATPAQESDMIIRDDTDYVGVPGKGWTAVDEMPKGAKSAWARKQRGE